MKEFEAAAQVAVDSIPEEFRPYLDNTVFVIEERSEDGLMGLYEGATALAALQLHAAAQTASLVCTAALAREESRGCHLRSDLPQASDQWHGDLVMHKDRGARFDRHL